MRLVVLSALTLALAGCGGAMSTSTTTVVKRPQLGPPRGEGMDKQPVKRHYQPAKGTDVVIQPVYHAAAGCGIERWAVKTATDPAASAINPTPQDTTISQLDSIAPPVSPTDRVAPTETSVFRIQATITAIKQEGDLDYHLALSDGQGNTMIAESPSPTCDVGGRFASEVVQVRQAIDQACPSIGSAYQDVSIPADLTGVGFFDRLHHQRAVAPNGIELHELLAIKLNGHC